MKRADIAGRSVAAPSHASRIACAISDICSMVIGDIAVPTSQQHMTAGFMLVSMENVVSCSVHKFFSAHVGLSCLDLFQSMLMKIIFATAVLCSSGSVSCSVAADSPEVDHADDIVLLVK